MVRGVVKAGPVSVVFKMLANLLPEYASLAIPLGLLLGILLAFRKLATTSELDTLRAVGMSYTRQLRVPSPSMSPRWKCSLTNALWVSSRIACDQRNRKNSASARLSNRLRRQTLTSEQASTRAV